LGFVILLAMIVVPITEIAVFIQAGDLIGLWPTIGAVILTAFVGTALLRHQGLSTLVRVQESMNAGRLPVTELFDGLCLLIAGAFLLTPGFVTDGVGLLLFVPMFRALLRGLMARRLQARGDFNVNMHGQSGGERSGHYGGTIIDGEFNEVDADETRDKDENKNPCDPDSPLPPPR